MSAHMVDRNEGMFAWELWDLGGLCQLRVTREGEQTSISVPARGQDYAAITTALERFLTASGMLVRIDPSIDVNLFVVRTVELPRVFEAFEAELARPESRG